MNFRQQLFRLKGLLKEGRGLKVPGLLSQAWLLAGREKNEGRPGRREGLDSLGNSLWVNLLMLGCAVGCGKHAPRMAVCGLGGVRIEGCFGVDQPFYFMAQVEGEAEELFGVDILQATIA